MFKKLLVTTASAATFALAACGGGGGSDVVPPPGGGNNGGNNPPPVAAQRYAVAGPLDVVQAPVSSMVFGQLQSATGGTPLEGLLVCADRAVNQDALDIADTVANALQNAAVTGTSNAAALAATVTNLNASVNQLANDVQGLLNALANGGGCGGNGLPVGALGGTNPLAGTPLAPLGTELSSVLFAIRSAHGAGTTLSLASLSTLTGQLTDQFDAGIAGMLTLAPGVPSTPIISGVLVSVQQMLADVDGLVQAVAQLDAEAAKASLNALLANVLSNSLTRAVPLRFVEAQRGQIGLFSNPLTLGAASVADVMSGVGTLTTQALKDQLTDQLETVAGPFAVEVLPVLSTQIYAVLGNLGSAAGPTGTPLDAALVALTGLLEVGGGFGGQPVLDLIVSDVLPICPTGNPLVDLVCGLGL